MGPDGPDWWVGTISIHAPRVGCDVQIDPRNGYSYLISIHAPRVGCDGG